MLFKSTEVTGKLIVEQSHLSTSGVLKLEIQAFQAKLEVKIKLFLVSKVLIELQWLEFRA